MQLISQEVFCCMDYQLVTSYIEVLLDFTSLSRQVDILKQATVTPYFVTVVFMLTPEFSLNVLTYTVYLCN